MMEIPKPEKIKNNISYNIEDFLDISPSELAERLVKLEENGDLENFLDQAIENELFKAQVSYWEKWLSKEAKKLVDQIVNEKKKIYDGAESEQNDSLPLNLEEKYSEKELKLIFSHISSIQLTFGCSKGCPFCGFDAVPGVREHIPYYQLANFFQKYGKEIGSTKPMLYYASEPSDYEFEDKTYQDVHQLALEYADYDPHITTREEDDDWLKFIDQRQGYNRISTDEKNKEEIESFKNNYSNIRVTEDQGNKHIPGIGLTFSEDNEYDPSNGWHHGIACKDGFLLTPRGLYNTVVPIGPYTINKQHPQGYIIVPFEELKDIQIAVGDRIEKILKNSVILNNSLVSSSISSYEKDYLNLSVDMSTDGYVGEHFRKRIDIQGNNNFYKIIIDDKGIIHYLEEVSQKDFEIDCEKAEKYQKRIRAIDNIEEEKEHLKNAVQSALAKRKIFFNQADKDEEDKILSFLEKCADVGELKLSHLLSEEKDPNLLFGFWKICGAEDNGISSEIIIKINLDSYEAEIIIHPEGYVETQSEENQKKREWFKVNANQVLEKALNEGDIKFYSYYTERDKDDIINKLKEGKLNIDSGNIDAYGGYKIFNSDEYEVKINKVLFKDHEINIILFTDSDMENVRMIIV